MNETSRGRKLLGCLCGKCLKKLKAGNFYGEIYIPKNTTVSRNYVFKLKYEKLSNRKIAEMLDLTPRRINQILKNA